MVSKVNSRGGSGFTGGGLLEKLNHHRSDLPVHLFRETNMAVLASETASATTCREVEFAVN
jgi:hypothetical protein